MLANKYFNIEQKFTEGVLKRVSELVLLSKVSIVRDGNQWCCTLNAEQGDFHYLLSGFGDTPIKSFNSFLENYYNEDVSKRKGSVK